MRNARLFQLGLMLFSLVVALHSAVAQVVVATVPVGIGPADVAANSKTNQIYVVNEDCSKPPCPSAGTVTVIDGADNSTKTVPVGVNPFIVAVNPTTNQIYVTNNCGNDLACKTPPGTVTVIDGATNNTSTINVGVKPRSIAVNPVTNQIYIVNRCGADPTCAFPYSPGTVTVIDGISNKVVTTITVGYYAYRVRLNSVTNQIYVVNPCGNDSTCKSAGTVSVIDGASNKVVNTVTVGFSPYYAAVDSVTNQVYVSNKCGNDVTCKNIGTVTDIDGVSNNATTVNAGVSPYSVAVNSVTDNIYVANVCGNDLTCKSAGTVTVIDGGNNNSTATVNVGVSPYFVNVDSVTNETYVPNYCGNDPTCKSPGTVTVINGATNNTVSVPVGNDSQIVEVNAITDRMYVTNYADNTVSVIGYPGVAWYDSTLGAPKCDLLFRSCDSGPSLLLGRDNMTGGAESNEPNTIHSSCADGTAGTFHVDESIDRLQVATTNGLSMAQGAIVKISATVWVADTTQDALDLYYATNANNPTWTYITTLVPRATGSQTLSALYRLGPGRFQAVRAQFRKGGAKSPCSTGNYDDHDDLAFAVR